MRVKAKPILSFLLNPFGLRIREIEFCGGELLIRDRSVRKVLLKEISSPPVAINHLIWATVKIQIDNEAYIILRGVNRKEAQKFVRVLRGAWDRYNLKLFEEKYDEIYLVVSSIDALKQPVRYPAACVVSLILEKAQALEKTLFSKVHLKSLTQSHLIKIQKIRDFINAPQLYRDNAIIQFEKSVLLAWEEFFDTFEKNPLTSEQRLSVITDEDATLVLAGAGSGKTSVITAKAGYLIKSGIRTPKEILLLAFAKDAAKEMGDRIEHRCGVSLEVRTFHALAYDIIGEVEGRKPALVAHATDEKAYLALIKEILKDLVGAASIVSKYIIGWFCCDNWEEKNEWDFQQKHDYYTYIEKSDLRTLQGEQVKSFEELMIANWLYENGVEYEYEPNYEYHIEDTKRRDYCPDFRLKKSGVYIEHFGVRRKKLNDGSYRFETAPFVDREEYLAGMEWKREVHRKYQTTLIETFSYERQENRLLEGLAEKIKPFERLSPRSPVEMFDRVIELNQADGFIHLLGVFLRHYKGGGYNFSDCEDKGKLLNLGRRATAFMVIFKGVYQEYQKRLGKRIDFEDMILRATHYVESGQFNSPFHHILVDEFQDISRSRGKLIKALKDQNRDNRIFAVGDDWQSIYRFAGADITLMRNFGDTFGGSFDGKSGIHRTIDLGRTFRSVDKVAYAARDFILKNPSQIQKTIIPAGTTTQQAIQIVPTFRHNVDEKLRDVLKKIATQTALEGKFASVLLLGRYRYVCPNNLVDLQREFTNLNLSFQTIHSSKGTEADHVIVLNLYRGRTGFPSEIVDDPLLGLVSPQAEHFENAEERRVMYVAMTRARYSLTLMSSSSRPSAFVSELLKDLKYENEDLKLKKICGECGGDFIAFPTKNGDTWYRCQHAKLCGHSLPACTACGIGLPERKIDEEIALCSCGASFSSCPECRDGWLIERSGPYGRFLGCVNYARTNCKGKKKF